MTDLYQRFNYTMEVNKYLGEEISYIQKKSRKNLVEPSLAIINKNYIIRFLGYLGKELSLYRIRTLIEVNPSNEIIRDITFKMILSGLATQRAYKLVIDSDKEKNRFKENIQNFYDYIQEIADRLISFHQ